MIWTLVVVGGLLFSALTVQVARHGGLAFDVEVLEFMAAHRGAMLDKYFRWVTWGGSGVVLVPFAVALMIGLLCARRYREALLIGLGFVGAALSTAAIKVLIARERPALFAPLMELPESFSFPSGHATQVTAFALVVLIVLRRLKPEWYWPACAIALVLVLSVAISRLYLQVHYPSDVLGGILVGFIWVFAVNGLLSRQWHAGRQYPPRGGQYRQHL